MWHFDTSSYTSCCKEKTVLIAYLLYKVKSSRSHFRLSGLIHFTSASARWWLCRRSVADWGRSTPTNGHGFTTLGLPWRSPRKTERCEPVSVSCNRVSFSGTLPTGGGVGGNKIRRRADRFSAASAPRIGEIRRPEFDGGEDYFRLGN